MATPFQLHLIAENSDFQRRMRYFMVKGAAAVLAETLSTAGHTERAAYAVKVVEGTAPVLQHGLAALTNATVSAAADASVLFEGGFNITDNDLEFATNEHWNAMSGFSSGPA